MQGRQFTKIQLQILLPCKENTKGARSTIHRFHPANSQVSTSDNLSQPPPPLLTVFPLNTWVILPLQLMKATVLAESSNLSIFIVIFLLQQCLLTVAR